MDSVIIVSPFRTDELSDDEYTYQQESSIKNLSFVYFQRKIEMTRNILPMLSKITLVYWSIIASAECFFQGSKHIFWRGDV